MIGYKVKSNSVPGVIGDDIIIPINETFVLILWIGTTFFIDRVFHKTFIDYLLERKYIEKIKVDSISINREDYLDLNKKYNLKGMKFDIKEI